MSEDIVNKPKHYNRPGGMECLEEMARGLGLQAVSGFCLCNVWKYRYRPLDKGGAEDMAKSDYYMREFSLIQDVIASGGSATDYIEQRRNRRADENDRG